MLTLYEERYVEVAPFEPEKTTEGVIRGSVRLTMYLWQTPQVTGQSQTSHGPAPRPTGMRQAGATHSHSSSDAKSCSTSTCGDGRVAET